LFVVFSANNIFTSTNVFSGSTQVTVEIQKGELKLRQLLAAFLALGKVKHGKSANKALVGKIIEINSKKYEVRFFSFEDTAGKLPTKMTFNEYATTNNILDMESASMSPLHGINFESFDFRRAKLNDGVYFTIAVRLVEAGK